MAMKYEGGLLLIAIFLLLQTNVIGVTIQKLKIPDPILNGTAEFVILDCDFTYEMSDTKSIVVKWYLNNSPQPVYQWIPLQAPPQALGVLKKKVDLEYRASDDNYTMHRAIKILHPTIEHSGDYHCHVSSFESEDDKRERFIIYVPSRYMMIRYIKPTEDTVNVSCQALGLFPRPTAELAVYKGRKQRRTIVSDTILTIEDVGGRYDATLYKIFQDENLAAETVFECVVSIPGTDYSVMDRFTYYPGTQNGSPNRTNKMVIVLSTEPSLIGVPTVMDSGASGFQVPAVNFLLLSLVVILNTVSLHWLWRGM